PATRTGSTRSRCLPEVSQSPSRATAATGAACRYRSRRTRSSVRRAKSPATWDPLLAALRSRGASREKQQGQGASRRQNPQRPAARAPLQQKPWPVGRILWCPRSLRRLPSVAFVFRLSQCVHRRCREDVVSYLSAGIAGGDLGFAAEWILAVFPTRGRCAESKQSCPRPSCRETPGVR